MTQPPQPSRLCRPHNFISVTRPNVPIDVVYPLLIDQLTGAAP